MGSDGRYLSSPSRRQIAVETVSKHETARVIRARMARSHPQAVSAERMASALRLADER